MWRALSSYMCSNTPGTAKVDSSYSHMRGPCLGCWFSHHSNCSYWSFEAAVLPTNPDINTDQWEPIYTTLLFSWSLYNYAPHAADILTPTTVVEGVDNHSWGLYYRRCCRICINWGCSGQIFHFSHLLGQLSSVLPKDESPHTGYTFNPWVVSFTPLE